MKKYKGVFLSWNGLLLPRGLNLSVCAGLEPFNSNSDLSKRTSRLNSSVWEKLSKGELVNYIQIKTSMMNMRILPYHYVLQLPNTHLVGLVYSTPVSFSALKHWRWLKYTNYLTGNFQQIFLSSLKIILLASSLGEEIDILVWWHFQDFTLQCHHIGHIKWHDRQ